MSGAPTAPELLSVAPPQWDQALRYLSVVRRLCESSTRTRSEVAAAATELGCSSAHLYDLLSRYQADPRLTSLLPHQRGPRPGGSLLAGEVDAVSSIAFQSMMADAADHHEYLFGVRREAMFLSGVTFSVKAASGLGSLIAGVALDIVHFPANIASLGLFPHLPLATVHGLGWISGPLPAVLTALCTLPLLIYSLDQEKYRLIKQALSERKKPMTGEGPHR